MLFWCYAVGGILVSSESAGDYRFGRICSGLSVFQAWSFLKGGEIPLVYPMRVCVNFLRLELGTGSELRDMGIWVLVCRRHLGSPRLESFDYKLRKEVHKRSWCFGD
jgi:hypothetical protein